jgi:small-conductance mechanosensitive channel
MIFGGNPNGQLWGELISALILVLIGVWLLWFWPRNLRRKVDRKVISEETAENALSKIHPKQGYLLILIAVVLTFMEFWKAGFLGYSRLLALIPAAVSIGLFVLWLRHRKKS